MGQALASRGFVTVVADYGLYPQVRYPGFLEDGARAVRWAQDHAAEFGGDPDRIVLVGHSAGAYNAAMIALDGRYLAAAGVDPRHIKALAGLSGPYDFLPLTDPIAERTFGEAADLPGTQPTHFVSQASPPAFLATGDADTMVFPRNTVKLAARLREAGVTVEERHYPGVDHVRMVLALSAAVLRPCELGDRDDRLPPRARRLIEPPRLPAYWVRMVKAPPDHRCSPLPRWRWAPARPALRRASTRTPWTPRSRGPSAIRIPAC